MPSTSQRLASLEAALKAIDAAIRALNKRLDNSNAPPAGVVWWKKPTVRLLGVPTGLIKSPASFSVSWTGSETDIVSVSMDGGQRHIVALGASCKFEATEPGIHRVEAFIGSSAKAADTDIFVVG